MNALYLKDLAQKTHRGLEGRIRQGRSAGGKAYGYEVVRDFNAKGEPIRGGRRINEAEAAVVRRIMTLSLATSNRQSRRRESSVLTASIVTSPKTLSVKRR